MQSLTEPLWRDRFADLRPLVQQEFPEITRQELHTVGNDWTALLALIQRTYNLDADVVQRRVAAIDVDREDEAAVAEREVAPASVAQLRLGAGFSDSEQERIRGLLGKLDRRLSNFPADVVELEISVKDRDTTSQKVTLEAWLPKFPHLAATSKEPDLHDALMDVREDLLRQMNDEISRRKNY